MRQFKRHTKFPMLTAGLVSLVLWLYASASLAEKSSADVYPVVNAGNSQTEISRSGLSAIFKMRLNKWNNGSAVIVYVLDDENPLHKKFSKLVLNVFPHQLRRAWNKAVFSGSGQAPRELETKEDMVEKISNTPGAIGYLSPADINEKIKILKIR